MPQGRFDEFMPRKLRVQYPGAIYHVMSRGDRREDIFQNRKGVKPAHVDILLAFMPQWKGRSSEASSIELDAKKWGRSPRRQFLEIPAF